ncbi:MAG TPA: patatin-like phospholipase family protein [Mycobacteriales bacterium]|nr:patatin-like phospholipase family protein [Mycobacteriales bacterium]
MIKAAEPEPSTTCVAPLAAAYGGGGVFGTAYGLGIAHALIDAGVPLASTPTIGTSAGSWVAACVATGIEFESLCTAAPLHVPDPTPRLLQSMATGFFGDAMAPLVTASAVTLPTMRRVLLAGDQFRLADMVAASSSVPALFRPTQIAGTTYVDGGVRSLVSADLATPAANLLVIAPIAGPMFGPGGRVMEALLSREIRRWERTTGGVAHLIRPNSQIAALARHPLQLFDRDRARDAYFLARAQAKRLLTQREGLAKLCERPNQAA